MISGVELLGGNTLSNYFLGWDNPAPAVSSVTPIVTPISVGSTMTLAQAQNLANAWMSEPIGVMATPVQQPSFWDTLLKPWAEVGGGLIQGIGQEAAGVATGINQKLPDLLLQSLFQKAGVSTVKVAGDDGKTLTYIQPAKAGVPAAKSGTQISTGTAAAGIATGTVLLIGVVGLIVVLAMRK